jgi:hypothetical protein
VSTTTYLYAPGIEVRWQPTDTEIIALLPTTNAIIALLPTTNATNHKKPGLSSGAIAGITIGCIAILCLLGFLLFFYLRRNKINRSGSTHDQKQDKEQWQKSELDGMVVAPVELPGNDNAIELPQLSPAELAGEPFPRRELTDLAPGSDNQDTND